MADSEPSAVSAMFFSNLAKPSSPRMSLRVGSLSMPASELRKKLGIKASSDVEIPEVPVNGTAKAAEAVKSRRG